MTPAEGTADDREPTRSRCGDRHGGTMGLPSVDDTGRRYGIQGPSDNPDPHVASHPANPGLDHYFTFPGGPATPSPWWGGNRDAPMMPWGRDDSLGTNPLSARGNMWGDAIGVSFGSPGSGIGLRTLCPTCGDTGSGARVERNPSASLGGGATGTARAGG